MLKQKNRIRIKAAAAAAGIVVFGIFVHFIGFNPVKSALKTVFVPFQNGFSYISYKVSCLSSFIWEMDSYREENEKLSQRVNELELNSKTAEQYREENDRLLGLLGLRDSITDYTSLAAKVIGYSSDSLYGTVEINKGTLNGVQKGNCVITNDGIVGTVTETGPNWATVSSLLNTDSAIGIRVSRTGKIGVVEGDAELARDGLCKMSFLDSNSSVIVGDMLETSGSGGVYPPKLAVGKIKDISSDNVGNLEYATVTPAVDFSKLYAVLVINGMKE